LKTLLLKIASNRIKRHNVVSSAMSRLDSGIGSTSYEESRPRIAINKGKFSEKDLLTFGFKPTLIAVPEPGQKRQTSWRHPEGYHAHDHGEDWVMHKDMHAVDMDSPLRNIKHMMFEGAPGAAKYVKHSLFDKRKLINMLEKEHKIN
jgi:hypothetical protein